MKTVRLLIVTLIALGLFGYSQARAGTGVSDKFEPYSLYSGEYSGRPSGSYVAYRARVTVPGAVELRLFFGKVSLGNSSYILITSLEDSSQQHLNAATISQWNNTTAYFNGSALEVELHVAPGDSHVFFNLDSVLVGTSNVASHGPDQTLTLVNNRTPSDDPAVGRLRDPANGNAEATAWIAANGYLVTAGHVAYLWQLVSNRSEQVLQFDVPNSQSDGTMVDPPEQDQYYINQWIWYADSTTLTGDDWAVFSVHPNSETGLYPIQAQQSYYEVEQNDTCSALRVTGYGNAGANSLNDTQQSATGADAGSSGQLLRYSVYISSGSSGSPVIDEYTGKVVGIVDDFGNPDYNVGTSMYNPGLWSYMQPKTQTATVTQFLSDNSIDTHLWRWNGSSFASISPGDTIHATTSNPAVLKGDQSPDNGQKYNNWTVNSGPTYDVVNPHKFLLLGTNYTSHLEPIYNATLESYLTDVSSTGFPVSFKDPWLIDYNDPTYGMRNRGMSGAPYESVPIASNDLGTSSSHQGVFSGLDPQKVPYYYSVAAPATESYNGHTWAFTGWSATDGTYFQNASAGTTAVVFGGNGSTVTANYKGLQLSTDPNALADDSQRKIVKASSGDVLEVYTSSIDGVSHVWLEQSTDGGSTWTLGNGDQPLDDGGNASNPTITASLYGDVYVLWQQVVGNSKYLYIRSLGNSIPTPVAIDTDVTNFDIQGSIAASDNGAILAVYRKSDGLGNPWKLYYNYSANGTNFSGGEQVFINTPVDFDNPSVAWNQPTGTFVVSCNSRSSPLEIPLFTFDGTNWQWPVNSYYSTSFPSTTPFSQIAVDGAGRDQITWIGYDDYYGENSAAMQVSYSNGSLSAVSIFRDEALNYPSIVYTSVAGHDGTGGGVSLLYTSASGSDQTLFDVWATDGVNFNGSLWLSPSGTPISYPNLLEKDAAQQVGFCLAKGSSSPYSLIYQSKDNSTAGSGTGMLKFAGSGDKGSSTGIPTWTTYRRLQLIDTTTGGQLTIQFGNISVGQVRINDFARDDTPARKGIDPSFMKTAAFSFSNGIPATVECGARAKNWTENTTVTFELVDKSTGTVLSRIRSFSLPSQDTMIYADQNVNLAASVNQPTDAYVRVTVQGIDSSKVLIIPANVYVLNSDSSNGRGQPQSVYDVLPADYSLGQNYPNPFNPTTTIQYALPSSGHVALRVYDVLGREVRTLVDNDESAGYHSVAFDASNLPSGVYFYRIEAGKYTSVKKLMLVK